MVWRSGDLPLHISPCERRNTLDARVMLETYTYALKLLHRSTAASLVLPLALYYPAPVPEVLQVVTSNVRLLRVDFGRRASEFGPLASENGVRFMEKVIFPNMTFPHLRDLSCSYASLRSLGKMLHPGLRRLELCGRTNTSLEQLLAVLEPMQSLVDLVLRDACTEVNTEAHDVYMSRRRITLANLRLLDITDEYTNSGIYLLHGILYPATGTSVRLQLHRS